MILTPDGTGKAPHIVLIHGFGATRYSWRHLVPELTGDATVFAVDMLGHGTSVPRGSYSMSAHAKAILGGLKKRGVTKVRLAGHSMGGRVACHMVAKAAAFGVEVERLALVAAAIIGATIPCRALVDDGTAEEEAEQILGRPPSAAEVSAFKAIKLGNHPNHPPEAGQIEAYSVNFGLGWRLAYARTAIRLGQRLRIGKPLSSFDMPKLAVWGKDDSLIDHDAAMSFMKRKFPGGSQPEILSLEECGHSPHEELPGKSVAPLAAFLLGS